jgi:hypothetical protein
VKTAGLALSLILMLAPTLARAGIREERPNQLALEVAGRSPGLGVGIGYERWLNDWIGLGAGLSIAMTCGECIGSQVTWFHLPVWASVNLPLSENHGINVAAGLTFPLANGSEDKVIPAVSVGYQLLAGRFVLRPAVILYAPKLYRSAPSNDPLLFFGLQIGLIF